MRACMYRTSAALLFVAILFSLSLAGCGGANGNKNNGNRVAGAWPEKEMKLYGPGPDSGTFDYFTEAINGKSGKSRTDYEASEDDEVIIKGVSENKYSLGYVGLAYYLGAKDKLKAVAVKDKDGEDYVLPTSENVTADTYSPLSRPLFIYVNVKSLKEKPQVREFIKFYMENPRLVEDAKYVPLDDIARYKQKKRLTSALEKAGIKYADMPKGKLTGAISVDGSSTVAPVTKKVAEVFKKKHGGINVSVGISGTGGGFKKFYAGETDISDASRPIKQKEIDECKKNNIEYIELKVGLDGLAVIINRENDWAERMTVEQLEQIWRPSDHAKKWSDVKQMTK